MSLLTARFYLSPQAKQMLVEAAANAIKNNPDLLSAAGIFAKAAKMQAKPYVSGVLTSLPVSFEVPEGQEEYSTKAYENTVQGWLVSTFEGAEEEAVIPVALYREVLSVSDEIANLRNRIEQGEDVGLPSDEADEESEAEEDEEEDYGQDL